MAHIMEDNALLLDGDDEPEEKTECCSFKGALVVVIGAALTMFWGYYLILYLDGEDAASINNPSLVDLIDASRMMETLRDLERQAVDDNRFTGLQGYTNSRDYIVNRLETDAPSLSVEVQPFDITFRDLVSSSFTSFYTNETTVYELETEYRAMSGIGNADIQDLPGQTIQRNGCTMEDFADFEAGNIAIVFRGEGLCRFAQRAYNAEEAGAAGVIIINLNELVPAANINPPVEIPVFSVALSLGTELERNATAGATFSMQSEVTERVVTSWNVFADTPTGSPDSIVVTGAHLDSVEAGPGMNDNGSGSAAILDMAIQMSRMSGSFVNKVRFAWWGAEEVGLLGSTHYIATLQDGSETVGGTRSLDQLACNVNVDMIGSPNYYLGVYDGASGDTSDDCTYGSVKIEEIMTDFLTSEGQFIRPLTFDGRSDYGPFIARGIDIPAGGIFSGGDSIKTPEDVEKWGGQAGEPFDPCYHLACDTLGNVGVESLRLMSRVAAQATQTLAMKPDLMAFLRRR